MIIPPFLQKGDTIAFSATARRISLPEIQAAISFIEEKGFRVHIDTRLFNSYHQLAGTPQQRAELFNDLLADDQIKAIWNVRGGFGSAEMSDLVDYSLLRTKPKWLLGFSDFTTILNQSLVQANVAGIHATMPIFMKNRSGEEYFEVQAAIDSALDILVGKLPEWKCETENIHNPKDFTGITCGGNLSVLYSIQGSASEPDYTDKVLILEDLDEYLYHADRMMLGLKRAGKLKNLKAILVGSFMGMHDHEIPLGRDMKEIILHHCSEYSFPIIFELPFGHHLKNLAIPIGMNVDFHSGIIKFAGS